MSRASHGPVTPPNASGARWHDVPVTHLAHDERLRLCDTLEQVGPDAPTLCSPWTTRDLAAHLAWREAVTDLSPSRLLAVVTGRARTAAYAAMEWPALVETVRSGPPALSPLAMAAVDERANTAELFIHHEDVRRAVPGWSRRTVVPELEVALWRTVGLFGRRTFRAAPVGVELVAPGQAPKRVKAATQAGWVRVLGSPGELALYCSGRQRVARVELLGSSLAATAALTEFGRR